MSTDAFAPPQALRSNPSALLEAWVFDSLLFSVPVAPPGLLNRVSCLLGYPSVNTLLHPVYSPPFRRPLIPRFPRPSWVVIPTGFVSSSLVGSPPLAYSVSPGLNLHIRVLLVLSGRSRLLTPCALFFQTPAIFQRREFMSPSPHVSFYPPDCWLGAIWRPFCLSSSVCFFLSLCAFTAACPILPLIDFFPLFTSPQVVPLRGFLR